MRPFFFVWCLAFACLFSSACSDNSSPAGAGLWPIPRMDSLEALKKNHRALEILSRSDPRKACIFAKFGIAEWLLAVRDIPKGTRTRFFRISELHARMLAQSRMCGEAFWRYQGVSCALLGGGC